MRKIISAAALAVAASFFASPQAMALKPMQCNVGLFKCLLGERDRAMPSVQYQPQVQVQVSRRTRMRLAYAEPNFIAPPRLKPKPAMVQVASLSNVGLSGRSNRDVVDWSDTQYPVGSIVVQTDERALYYVMPGGQAIRYAVGVGREGFEWSGVSRIDRKAEWPDWHPPAEMIDREAANGHIIPDFMPGGPGNPLGARALYLGGRIYRIHGTNNESSIGGAVSSGCIRMMNADIIDLYGRARVGAKVWVY